MHWAGPWWYLQESQMTLTSSQEYKVTATL